MKNGPSNLICDANVMTSAHTALEYEIQLMDQWVTLSSVISSNMLMRVIVAVTRLRLYTDTISILGAKHKSLQSSVYCDDNITKDTISCNSILHQN